MKAGILNVQWLNNYGAVLLAYAMQKKLDKMGVDNEVIDFRPCELDENGEIPSIHKEEKSSSKGKIKAFNDFRKNFLRSSAPVVGEEGCYKLNYDTYIVGSDTVWTPLCADNEAEVCAYYLDFAKNQNARKLSWSASIGSDDPKVLSSISDMVKTKLNNFDYISVRERETTKFVQSLTDKKVVNTMDPVLMLDKEDYDDILPGKVHDKPYIYLFTFDDVNSAYDTANELAERTGIPVSANVKHPSRQDHLVYNSEDDGPAEFVECVFKSKYVITDSYHGIIYSILARKPFVCYSRVGSGVRARNLLEDLGLGDRFLMDGQKSTDLILTPIDYDTVFEKVNAWREKSEAYLREALGLNK